MEGGAGRQAGMQEGVEANALLRDVVKVSEVSICEVWVAHSKPQHRTCTQEQTRTSSLYTKQGVVEGPSNPLAPSDSYMHS